MLLVSLSGYAQSGKDSTAHFFMQDHGFKRYAFADIMRESLLQLNPLIEAEGGYARLDRLLDFTDGWDRAKVEYPEVRRLMQAFGTEVGRNLLGEDVWVDALFKQLAKEKPERVVITDCRFQNEIAAVRERGGFPLWVSRPGVGPVNAHVSETGVSEDDTVETIPNDGTLVELRDKVSALSAALGF